MSIYSICTFEMTTFRQWWRFLTHTSIFPCTVHILLLANAVEKHGSRVSLPKGHHVSAMFEQRVRRLDKLIIFFATDMFQILIESIHLNIFSCALLSACLLPRCWHGTVHGSSFLSHNLTTFCTLSFSLSLSIVRYLNSAWQCTARCSVVAFYSFHSRTLCAWLCRRYRYRGHDPTDTEKEKGTWRFFKYGLLWTCAPGRDAFASATTIRSNTYRTLHWNVLTRNIYRVTLKFSIVTLRQF